MIRLSHPLIGEEEVSAVSKVLLTGMLVQGRYVSTFEEALEGYIQVKHAAAVSSGTAALHAALVALDIHEGDAVFTPAFTFPATVNVIELQKARPILVDVNPVDYNMDPHQLEQAIIHWKGAEIPRAILVVHEFGAPCDMTAIMNIANKYSLYVIEDAACALGTRWNDRHVGTFGDIGCFSWHPRKGITTGEGGTVVTSSDQLFATLSSLRNHGIELSTGKIDFVLPGFNYRMTDFQAALGSVQLKKFEFWLEKRRLLAELYSTYLTGFTGVSLPKVIKGHAWQTYMITLEGTLDRDQLIIDMKEQGIEVNLGAQAIHMLSYYRTKYQYKHSDYPNACRLYTSGLALPLHPNLTNDDILTVTRKLRYTINMSKSEPL